MVELVQIGLIVCGGILLVYIISAFLLAMYIKLVKYFLNGGKK